MGCYGQERIESLKYHFAEIIDQIVPAGIKTVMLCATKTTVEDSNSVTVSNRRKQKESSYQVKYLEAKKDDADETYFRKVRIYQN
jgi:hypothetical protein